MAGEKFRFFFGKPHDGDFLAIAHQDCATAFGEVTDLLDSYGRF